MKRVLLPLAAVLLLTMYAVAQYKVRLIDCPGWERTRFWGINDAGVIVGQIRGTDGFIHPMRYQNGVCENLQPLFPPEAVSGWATDINNRGDIVGNSHGSFLIRDGTVTYLPIPPVALDFSPQSINDKGEIVGYFFTDESELPLYGYKMNVDETSFTELTLPFQGVVDVVAWRLNDRGDIVGGWDSDPTTTGHGFVIPHKGTPFTFDVPQGQPMSTFGSGINDRGDLVGYFTRTDGLTVGFAIIGGQLLEIDSPTTFISTLPQAINNRRIIVGSVTDTNGVHGFIATPVGKVF